MQRRKKFDEFLESVSVDAWEFFHEISAVESVDEFAFFKRISDGEDWLGVFHEGFVEDVFRNDNAFAFGELGWSTISSTAEASESFGLNREENENDLKVHFFIFESSFFEMLLMSTGMRTGFIYMRESSVGPPLDGDSEIS